MASFSEKLNRMTQNAISKSKEVAGVTKLNLEIGSLNQDIKNIQTEVGRYVLEKGLLLEDESVADWAVKVAELKASIEENTEKIHELKNISICPGCGAEVSRASKFCDKCGTAIVIKTPEPAGADEVVVDADFTVAEEKAEGETTVEVTVEVKTETETQEAAGDTTEEAKIQETAGGTEESVTEAAEETAAEEAKTE